MKSDLLLSFVCSYSITYLVLTEKVSDLIAEIAFAITVLHRSHSLVPSTVSQQSALIK